MNPSWLMRVFVRRRYTNIHLLLRQWGMFDRPLLLGEYHHAALIDARTGWNAHPSNEVAQHGDRRWCIVQWRYLTHQA
jgi:hypothetical protein